MAHESLHLQNFAEQFHCVVRCKGAMCSHFKDGRIFTWEKVGVIFLSTVTFFLKPSGHFPCNMFWGMTW